MNDDKFWSFLEARRLKKAINRATGTGAYTGGGLAFARALQAQVGGTLVSLADQQGALHPVLDVGGMLVDFEGPARSQDEMLARAGWWLGINYDTDASQAARPDRVMAFREEDYPNHPCTPEIVARIQEAMPSSLSQRLDAAAREFGIKLAKPASSPARSAPTP